MGLTACGETAENSDSKDNTAVTTTTTAAETTTTAAPEEDSIEETTTLPNVDSIEEVKTTTTAVEEKATAKTGFNESTNILDKNGGLIYHIPNYFKKDKSKDDSKLSYTYKEKDGSFVTLMFSYIPPDHYEELNAINAELFFDSSINSLSNSYDITKKETKKSSLLGRIAYEKTFSIPENSNGEFTNIMMFISDNSDNKYLNYGALLFHFKNKESDYDYYNDSLSVLKSIEEDTAYSYESSSGEISESEVSEETYEHNSYYDIVESARWTDIIGSTHIIYKVKAKQNISISSTLIAYSESGSVIGKSSSDIVLTEGQTNYFEYYFDEDVSNAQLKPSAKAQKDSFTVGERNGVELVEYSITNDNLYLTLKQTADKIGAFAKYKILFYNGEQIVDTENGYYSVSAKNLDGKDSTDIAEIWTYGKTYDRIEFIYEP